MSDKFPADGSTDVGRLLEHERVQRHLCDVPAADVRRAHHFLRTGGDDAKKRSEESPAEQLAHAYYDSLFKEYCLADMSRIPRHRTADEDPDVFMQLGLRWRTEAEVRSGKGERVCGNVSCSRARNLTSYEVEFAYEEGGKSRVALVKLRLCRHCAKRAGWAEKKSATHKKHK